MPVPDGIQDARTQYWLDDLEANCSVLDITSETTRMYAEIRHGLRIAGQPILGARVTARARSWILLLRDRREAECPHTR